MYFNFVARLHFDMYMKYHLFFFGEGDCLLCIFYSRCTMNFIGLYFEKFHIFFFLNFYDNPILIFFYELYLWLEGMLRSTYRSTCP